MPHAWKLPLAFKFYMHSSFRPTSNALLPGHLIDAALLLANTGTMLPPLHGDQTTWFYPNQSGMPFDLHGIPAESALMHVLPLLNHASVGYMYVYVFIIKRHLV